MMSVDEDMDYEPNPYEDAPATGLLATHCLICGRDLLDAESIERGIGPICADKAGWDDASLPPSSTGIEKALSTAPQSLREAVGPHVDDPRKASNVATAHAAMAVQRGGKEAQHVIGSVIELTAALGYPALSERIKQRFVADEHEKGSGIRIQRAPGGRYAIFTPYSDKFVSLMRNVPGRQFARQPAPHNSVPEASWLQALNALVAVWPGRLALDWEGQVMLIPTEPLPLPAPETPPAGAPTSATGEQPPKPQERVTKGMHVELNDGTVMEVGWVSPDGTRIGVRKGPYGRMDAFLGTNEVKLSAPKPTEVEAVAREGQGTPSTARDLPVNLFPYQREGAIWLDTVGSGLLAYDMGLGKSPTSIAVIDPPCVVVCPASLRVNWVRELNTWRRDLTVASVGVAQVRGKTVKASTKIDQEQLKADVVVINYDILKGENLQALIARGCKTLICDESHYLKELKLKWDRENNRMVPGAGSQRAGHVWQLAQVASRRILLTGTPIKNYVYEIWAQLNLVAPQEFRKFHDFGVRYCGAQKTRFGWDYKGRTDSEELNKLISGRYMLRKTKDELKAMGMLPEKSRNTKELTLSEDVAKEYERAAREFLAWVMEHGGREAVHRAAKAPALTKLTSLRRLAAIGKAEGFIQEVIEHHDSTKRPLIVFGWHREALEAIIVALRENGLKVGQILGGDSATARQEAIDAFQEGMPREAPVEQREFLDVIVCSIQAAGVGLTLTRAREVFFIERAWSPADLVQAEDRAYRIGQKNDVAITYYDAAGTIDSYMGELLVNKASTFAAVIDGQELTEEDAVATVLGRMFEAAEAGGGRGRRPNAARGGFDIEDFDWAQPSIL